MCAAVRSGGFPNCTSVCPGAGAAGCPCDCQVVIGTNISRECNRFISSDFDVELLAFESEQCFIPALPFLEVILVVTVKAAHFAPHALALRSQALFGCRDKKPIVCRPAHFKAARQSFHYTETSGLVHEYKWGICKEMQHRQKNNNKLLDTST